LAKQLRLEVADLTDIGRKREINEDSVLHVVPKDPRDMERKGALFVVADGMGGHAAGEVASEMAVELIRDHYYADPDSDVLQSLARAIKEANAAIFRRASELAGRAGMGTTCVAAVLKGAVAYVMNVGDSRAYLVRNGLMRLVTQDHSWVAEQVRAGMLTEDQARVHAHRHVITRALGTQPDVEPDIFAEPLQEGDILLLCSDGLSGYVSDLDISAIVTNADPHASVHALIDRANEQGGPDNITAIVVRVLEVPPLSPEVKEQLRSLDPSREPTLVLRAPLSQGARLRPALVALAAAALIALLVGATGPQLRIYLAGRQLSEDVAHAQALVNQAEHRPPAQALPLLAQAQQQVQRALQLPASSAARAHAEQVLTSTVTPAVQRAIQSYNQSAYITALARITHTKYTVACPGGLGTLAQIAVTEPTSIPAPEKASTPARSSTAKAATPHTPVTKTITIPATVYVRDIDNAVYPLQFTGTTATCGVPVTTSGVIDMAADGGSLYLLTLSPAGQYTVQVLAPGQRQPAVLLSLPANLTGLPAALAVRKGTIYVLVHGITAGQDSVLAYSAAQSQTNTVRVLVSGLSIRCMAASVNGDLYLLLDDGTFEVLQHGQIGHAISVDVAPPLAVVDPSQFTATMPVPTPVPAQPAGTSAPAGNGLALASKLTTDQNAIPQILVTDGFQHRIVVLSAGNGSSGVRLRQQLVDQRLLTSLRDVAVSADGHTIYALTSASLIEVILARG